MILLKCEILKSYKYKRSKKMVKVKVVKIFIDRENGEEPRKYSEVFETTEERAKYLHSHGAIIYLEETEQVEEVVEDLEDQKR